MNIVLASASPRRAELLKQLKLHFTVDPSHIEEVFDESESPENIVTHLSNLKGSDVAGRHSNSLIIAADTMVFLDGEQLGKPADFTSAKNMLQLLSGRQHEVYTGVYIAETGHNFQVKKSVLFYERTKVQFTSLTEHEIKYYVQSERPFDKAGSYGIQDDIGALFIKSIEGDYYNVVGFPIHSFYQTLKKNFPDISEKLFFTHA